MNAIKTVFVAGASGAIGQVLCRLLISDGWAVVGTTRSPGKASQLKTLGVKPVIVDVFDRDGLIRAACVAQPSVVIHQLTDLPKIFTAAGMAAARPKNAKVREIGTDNLVAAAIASGAHRIVAQSIAFAYANGSTLYSEQAPLDAASYPSVIKLEHLVLGSGLHGIILRYGYLYGANTWTMLPTDQISVHVDAAADAARRAATQGQPGVYNIVEDNKTVTNQKARNDLGWNPSFRCSQ